MSTEKSIKNKLGIKGSSGTLYDFNDKSTALFNLNQQFLNKTLSMFEYEGLPQTIPARELEKILQINGMGFVMEHEKNLYVFKGNMGGEPDPYDNGTEFVLSNAHFNLSGNFNIESDGVLIRNDSLNMGLMPLFNRYNSLIVENDINLLLWSVNSRTQKTFIASTDKEALSINQYLKNIYEGKMGCVTSELFSNGLEVNSTANNSFNVNQYLELYQFIKGSLFTELGLSSQIQLKKERLISSELDQGEDSIFTLAYNMMEMRQEAINKINEKFSLDIKIDFGSVWKYKNKKLVNGIVGDELESISGVEPEQNGGSNSGEPEYNKNLDDETTESEHNEDIGERSKGAKPNHNEENEPEQSGGKESEEPKENGGSESGTEPEQKEERDSGEPESKTNDRATEAEQNIGGTTNENNESIEQSSNDDKRKSK